jgi:YidC/Oxa1 family membrane protein insertase
MGSRRSPSTDRRAGAGWRFAESLAVTPLGHRAPIQSRGETDVDRNTLIALGATIVLYFGWQWTLDRRYPDRGLTPKPAISQPARPDSHDPVRPQPATPEASAALPLPTGSPTAVEEQVRIERPLYSATFTTQGGALREWTLKQFDDASLPGKPLVSITTDPDRVSLATPLTELGLGDLSNLPYVLTRPSEDVLEFTADVATARIRKTFRLEPDGYGARLSIELENRGRSELRASYGVRWPARRGPGAEFTEFGLAAYQTDETVLFAIAPLPSMLGMGGGPATESIKVEPKAGDPHELDWAGAHTRYFIAAILPDKPQDGRAEMLPIEPGTEALLEVSFAPVSLPPGAKLSRDYRLYLGPKEDDRLEAFGAHLDEAIQKGWAPSLARFFTAMLTFAHGIVPNYGLAILLLTIVIRVAMAPLMVGQMRSMKRMADLAPKVKAAQERFPDDRVKQQEAVMAVYNQAGVSPFSMFGGCLPMLLQLPIFVGFYSALQGSIQLRQQPFYGWITDLSQPESLFMIPMIDLHVRALPLLLGGAMVLQQRLTPTPNMDPAQARMMQIVMPVMMTVMFYQFASGLGLYWLMSTLLGIGQQLLMNRSKTPAAA